MNINLREVAEGAAMARRALGKPEPGQQPKTQAERQAEWLAAQSGERRVDTAGVQVRQSVEHTRRDLHTPGTAYSVGSQRYAADGTLWTRAA